MTRAQFFNLLTAFLSLTFIQPVLAHAPTNAKTEAVDKLFAKWTRPNGPGGVVAVLSNGKTIYSHAYGLANLDYNIRNEPSTSFDIASMSKQFTAFSIYLLAQDKQLSLDDDVRKYVPELHDFGKTITIRNLLNHTSGLRDQMYLLALSGRRWDDAITQQDALNIVWRQKELNFAPGDQYLYSNTGYMLLGLIVSRVSGLPLREFTEQRIFRPLGMTHTHIQDDYGVPISNRAYSYWTGPSGFSRAFAYKQEDKKYKYLALSSSVVGFTGLFTTAGDLALWDENFYSARVGGRTIITDMETKAHLNNGKEINYGAGLSLGKYRGLETVGHDGGDAAYTSYMLQFPSQHFSVFILSNTGDMNLGATSHQIADIYLEGKFKTPPSIGPMNTAPNTSIDPKRMDIYLGDYQLRPDYLLTFSKENGTVMVQGTGQTKVPTFPISDGTLTWGGRENSFTFDSSANWTSGGILHGPNGDIVAKKVQRTSITPDQIQAYVGNYYSDELNIIYEVREDRGGLTVRYSLGDYPLEHVTSDVFIGTFPISKLQFTRDNSGMCNGFAINDDRAQNIRFNKVSLAK